MPQTRSLASLGALLAALSTALVVSARQAPLPAPDAGNVLPFAATERTLPNGLRLIVVPTGFPNLVSVQIPVQTGSRNEVEEGKSGFAHFFEHLMFRGTPRTPPDKYREIMTKAGARDNASTNDDATTFYATFATEDLDTVLAVYGDLLQNLAYPEADFKTEARAILGEYNKNSAAPMQKLFEVQRNRFYQVHTYKHTTMGFVEDIEAMPNEYAYSKLFFERWYRPQYTTLVVAGDVNAEDVGRIVDKYFGAWKGGGSEQPIITQEAPHKAAQYVHVPWPSDTLPIVTVGFAGPAFDENSKDTAAMEVLAGLYFGRTSDLYKKLVVNEQKVDLLDVDVPSGVDPSLFTVIARVKRPGDAVAVRDDIVATIARARASIVPQPLVDNAKSYSRYAFARTLDSTERIASVVAHYASYRRSYSTVNNYYRTLDSLTAEDLRASARKYFTTPEMIVTTLAREPLPSAISQLPVVETFAPAPEAFDTTGIAPGSMPSGRGTTRAEVPLVLQKSVLPQLEVKLLFSLGSAHDPAGKEGLAALTASMIARSGSRSLTIDQIEKALYPIAGSFTTQVDKEMTTFTWRIHKDEWRRFLPIVTEQLLSPGFRDVDFTRLKEAQLNALTQDLRSNNEEELGKEELQISLFRGTPYGHVPLGTVAGINAVTLDDVRQFARQMYTQANLTIGISGDASDELISAVQLAGNNLPAGPSAARVAVTARQPTTNQVEILEKDTRATAISFGFPIEVTRNSPDFPALSVARAALGEHRMQSGRLFQRIREIRGLNYGDYAYIEAYPRGMFSFFPSPNLARQRQIFEVWIRPVVPVNAQMSLRIAISELRKLVDQGLSQDEFETTRDYLMKNVYVMTARQDEQLGYALDSRWYGIGEFTGYMRTALGKLTRDEVNAAVKRHLSADRLSIVIVAKDAPALKQALASDAFSPIEYDGEKPQALLDEDKVIGALKLNVPASNIRITPISDVFAR